MNKLNKTTMTDPLSQGTWRPNACTSAFLSLYTSVSLCSWQIFWYVFSFLVYKVRDSAVWKLNWGWKRKQWGKGWGEKAVTKTACNQPLEIFEMPNPVLWKEEFALRGMWHVLRSNTSQHTVKPKLYCLWPFNVFRQQLGNNFVHQNWIVELFHYQIKILNIFKQKSHLK